MELPAPLCATCQKMRLHHLANAEKPSSTDCEEPGSNGSAGEHYDPVYLANIGYNHLHNAKNLALRGTKCGLCAIIYQASLLIRWRHGWRADNTVGTNVFAPLPIKLTGSKAEWVVSSQLSPENVGLGLEGITIGYPISNILAPPSYSPYDYSRVRLFAEPGETALMTAGNTLSD